MTETDLHIVEQLRKLLPPLTPEEQQQPKENIESDGRVRDPILFWHDGKRNVVIDGMHRWDIVRRTPIPCRAERMHFDNYEVAEVWILNHQLGRRNLLYPTEIRNVRGELYNRLKTTLALLPTRCRPYGCHRPRAARGTWNTCGRRCSLR